MNMPALIQEEAEIKFNKLYDEVLKNITICSAGLKISDNAVCLVAASVLFDQFGNCCSDVRHSNITFEENYRIISFAKKLSDETKSISDCMVLLSRVICIIVGNMIDIKLENEKTKE